MLRRKLRQGIGIRVPRAACASERRQDLLPHRRSQPHRPAPGRWHFVVCRRRKLLSSAGPVDRTDHDRQARGSIDRQAPPEDWQ